MLILTIANQMLNDGLCCSYTYSWFMKIHWFTKYSNFNIPDHFVGGILRFELNFIRIKLLWNEEMAFTHSYIYKSESPSPLALLASKFCVVLPSLFSHPQFLAHLQFKFFFINVHNWDLKIYFRLQKTFPWQAP